MKKEFEEFIFNYIEGNQEDIVDCWIFEQEDNISNKDIKDFRITLEEYIDKLRGI